MIDIPKLRKAVEWVEEQQRLNLDERDWYQGSWAADWDKIVLLPYAPRAMYCGTTYCVAGKVAVDAGWQPVFKTPVADVVQKDGERKTVARAAADELGLTDTQARQLFNGANNAADVRFVAEVMAGERL